MSLIVYLAGLPIIWLAAIVIMDAILAAFERPLYGPKISSKALAAAIKTRELI